MVEHQPQYVTIVTLGLAAFLLTGFIKSIHAIQCYQCDRVNRPSDCTHVTTCPAGQECTVVKFEGSGVQYYSTGCVDQKFCLNNGPSLIGRRFLVDVRKCVSCCQGDMCNTRECSAAHEWVTWQPWSQCSASCDGGNRFRSRTCPDGQCSGKAYEIADCNTQSCVASWSTWNAWSACSVTCGVGYHKRNRTCSNPSCPDASQEMQRCSPQGCPVDGGWAGWSTWFPCSATCGAGTSIRVRTCSRPVPQNGGKPCDNYSSFKEAMVCSVRACPSTVPTTSTTTATTTTTATSPPCIDSAGSTCSNALYLQYACADNDLKKLCSKSCGLCH